MKSFETMISGNMNRLMQGARRRIVYAAPGISKTTADELINTAMTRDIKVEVILDPDPDTIRMGYGEQGGLEGLASVGMPIRKAIGLRIGLLVVDDQAWIFTCTPLVLESEPGTSAPNAIRISSKEADRLIEELCPQPTGEKPDPKPVIGEQTVTRDELDATQKSLKERPPVQFDLSRQLNVYQSMIQFVELSIHGCQINRHTIQIPKDLLSMPGDKEVGERLKASFKLLDASFASKTDKDNHSSLKDIERRIAELRKEKLKMIPHTGMLILKNHRNDFDAKLKEIEGDLNQAKEMLKKDLDDEIKKWREKLTESLFPAIQKNPPQKLLNQIPEKNPSEEQIQRFIQNELEPVIPNVDAKLNNMRITCNYKDVTIESLRDSKFQDQVKKVYPIVNWDDVFKETKAVEKSSGDVEM